MRVLVLGLGNTLMGDDGVGVRVLEGLGDLGPEVEIVNGAIGGLSLFDTLKQAARIIVIDAVDMGRPPGTVVRLSADELLKLPAGPSFSLHEFGLFEVLKLGQSLKEDFGHVIIIGVQPKEVRRSELLSAEVEASVPVILEMVKMEVKNNVSHA